MAQYQTGDAVLVLYALDTDNLLDRRSWHWVRATVLDHVVRWRAWPTYRVAITDTRYTLYGRPIVGRVAYREASEMQPVRVTAS